MTLCLRLLLQQQDEVLACAREVILAHVIEKLYTSAKWQHQKAGIRTEKQGKLTGPAGLKTR